MSNLDVAVGDQIGTVEVQVTRETLVKYAGASGDFNPIHYSNFAAQQLGLDGVIAHGMLTMGAAIRVVTDWSGIDRLKSYSVRFRRPVPIPDDGIGVTLNFSGTVTAVEAGIATVNLEAKLDGEMVLGKAVAEVHIS